LWGRARPAALCGKAGDRIRTGDVQLGKLEAHEVSTSIDNGLQDLPGCGAANPIAPAPSEGTFPPSGGAGDADLTAMLEAMREAPAGLRGELVRHVLALLKLSEAKRRAILATTAPLTPKA